MRCKRIQKRLPLFAGGDLTGKKQDQTRRHLMNCHQCKEEYNLFRMSQAGARGGMRPQRISWDEGIWKGFIEKAVKSPGLRPMFAYPKARLLKIPVAALLVPAIFLGIFLLVIRPDAGTSRFSNQHLNLGVGQKSVAITFLSRKTGVKIKWFLNKNFNLEEIK